jgi:hypothetical protein
MSGGFLPRTEAKGEIEMSNYILRKGKSVIADLKDGLSSVSMLGHGGGNSFYLDPTNGNDGNDGTSPEQAVKTFPVAYALLVDGNHDILYYISGSTSLTLTAQIAWAKSYTHFIGVAAPAQTGSRARIFSPATGTISPIMNITGSGCVFANLYVVQQSVNASALIDVTLAGGRNYFYNCHFTGPNNSTGAVDGACALNMASGASENVFERCTLGVDTVDAPTGVVAVMFPATGGIARNRWIDCDFTIHAGHAGAAFLEFPAAVGVDRYQIFRDCLFINDSLTQMTSAFTVNSDFGTASTGNKKLILKDCWMVGAPQYDATQTHYVIANSPAVTSADLQGVLVVNHAD